ncbi:HAD family hydrolase [Streptomyces goshikiensis]|uniref:HAD family hydrolase n=1 Tax=Streptomyces goshikiensis TaxID=1942 RepID=UPI003647661C
MCRPWQSWRGPRTTRWRSIAILQEGGSAVLAVVEAALTAAVIRAVKVAGTPAEGAIEALQAALDSGGHIAVVSNNSAECLGIPDRARDCAIDRRDYRASRPVLRPDLMKPSPHPLLAAASDIGVAPNLTVLIGDSLTEVETARAAGTGSVGYANKPPKEMLLAEAGADAVVLGMGEITDSLRSSVRLGRRRPSRPDLLDARRRSFSR